MTTPATTERHPMAAGPAATRVAIIDDQPLVVRALARLLDGDPRFTVTSTGSTGDDLAALLATGGVDLAVVDVHLGQSVSTSLVRALRREHPTVRFVVMTSGSPSTVAGMAAEAGAHGWVVKGGRPDDICCTLAKIAGW